METESKTDVRLRPTSALVGTGKVSAFVTDEFGTRVVAILSMAELQGLVQDAYDEHGLLAEPSIEVEVSRVIEADPDERLDGGVDCGFAECASCAPFRAVTP